MITGVWLGRFQPIHNGHLDFLRMASEYCDEIFVFAVGSSQLKGAGIAADVMDASHERSRNPFPLADRFRWLTAAVDDLGMPASKIHCSMGPRIDYDPAFYQMALPENRVFLVSDHDSAEERKKVLLEMAGETCLVVRSDGRALMSSTMVRQALLDENIVSLKKMLPRRIVDEVINNYSQKRTH